MTTVESPGLSQQTERGAREFGIPPCPSILARFAAEMRAADPDLRKLAGLTSSDAGLSAAMIKTVNAPFYGLASKAASVQQALSVLGLRAGAKLVTGLTLRNAFPASALMQRFWDSSAKIARAAAAIAIARGWMLPEPMCLEILHHHAVDPSAGGRRATDAAVAKLIALGLLAEQIVALQAGHGLCPDWRVGEAFVLETLGLEADDVVALAQEPLAEAA